MDSTTALRRAPRYRTNSFYLLASITVTSSDVALTPLNSLAFQYRGSDNPGAPKPLDEPSIDYADFITLLNDGYVKFVEFLAPNGDKAYATIVLASKDDKDKKDAETMRIRIGRGYPTEDPEGWSSPSFVIRTVKEKVRADPGSTFD